VAEIRTVAVIGAGIMGRGIAHAAALGGYPTILEDILPNALRKAETEIRAHLDQAVELGSGELMCLESGIHHDVKALEESAFLITISWPGGSAEERHAMS